MPPQERLIIVVAAAEVAEQARGQSLDLVLRHAHDAADHLAAPRLGAVQLLARQEEPRDDTGWIGAQTGLNTVRDHYDPPRWRACCAVVSIARVDSAPWLRLRP